MSAAVYGRVVNDKTPTEGAKSERYLAVALGYPLTWRVRRRLDESGRVFDVIYAGNPKKGADRWYNHEAALLAAQEFNGSNPYQFKGGHMSKRQPRFQKGDYVEVKYNKRWNPASILKRKQVDDDIRYTVHYTEDNSMQDHVREHLIRFASPDTAAMELAVSLGFPEGWKASVSGTRYIITSADGATFRSKKAALEYLASTAVDGEDPPWRTTGHELVGKKILLSHSHKLSGLRSITVDQVGTVVGWISKTDTDSQGQPGYICEATGKPAHLFHVTFDDEPGHAYAKHLIHSQDMEEDEVRGLLVEDDEPRPKRRKR